MDTLKIASLGHFEKEAITTVHPTLPNLTLRRTISCLLLEPLRYSQMRPRQDYSQRVILNDCVRAHWSPRHSPESLRHKTLIGGFSSHFHACISVLWFPYFSFRTCPCITDHIHAVEQPGVTILPREFTKKLGARRFGSRPKSS